MTNGFSFLLVCSQTNAAVEHEGRVESHQCVCPRLCGLKTRCPIFRFSYLYAYTVHYLGGCIMGNVQCMFSCLARERASVWTVCLLCLLIPWRGDTTHHAVENHMSYGIVNNKNETG